MHVSASVAHVLDIQKGVNAQLKVDLMVVNQRIDLVQEQIETLWQLAQLGCQWKFPGLCVTSIQYENFTCAANLSKQLSSYLLGNWTGDCEFNTCGCWIGYRIGFLDCCHHEPSQRMGGNRGPGRNLGPCIPCMPLVSLQDEVCAKAAGSNGRASIYSC